MTNTASLVAILLIYRKDIIRLICGFIGYIRTQEGRYKPDFLFVIYIVVGSIPAGVLGLLLSDIISASTSMTTVAIMLFVTGIALWLIRNMRGRKTDGDISAKDALLVGFGQAVALTPGISRSGATVISAIAVGMRQDTALRFSFMLYIPVSLGTIVLGISDFLGESNKAELALPYAVTFITTVIVTYMAMKWFMGIMKKGKLHYYAYYCFAMGSFLLIYF